MNLHLLDLRPIKNLASAEKSNLPVSVTTTPDGKLLVINRYGDSVWDFYPYITPENVPPSKKQINWHIDLPDGRQLTDPEHAGLLESTKDLIWSLFSDPVEGRKRPAMSTIRNKALGIAHLLRYMVHEGMPQFAALAGRTLDYVPVAKIGENGKPLAPSSACKRLIIVEDLYHQRDKIKDALPVHPWAHETAVSLAGVRKGAHLKPKTALIPDAVISRLTTVALDYIQNQSEPIFEALAVASEIPERLASAGYSRTTQMAARIASCRQSGYEGARDLIAESNRLRTACYIVIDMFSGIRDSEMMSLEENCIAHGMSKDGSTEVLWLYGTIYKTGVQPKRWLVPPVIKEAIQVLTRLTAPLRERMRQEEAKLAVQIDSTIAKEQARLVRRLDTVRKHKNKLFLSPGMNGGEVAVLSGTATNDCLKAFCVELGIYGEDGQPYHLHPHQFRRTYAHFVARAELGDLLTLRDHFGHWSIDMTTLYTDGGADGFEVDTELLEMVATAKHSRQTEIMTDYLDSDTPLANGGHWLKEWRSSVRTATNKEELIAEYAGTITLNGTGHSWCVGNVKGTGCGGLCVFEANMCVDCSYGIIGPEHLPVWKGIASQQEETLAMDDLGIPGKARAQRILDKAHSVIAKLEAV